MCAKRSARAVLGALVLACAVIGPAWPAAAQPKQPAGADSKAAAGTHYRRGIALLQDNDFAAALIELKRAYQIDPKWQVLYNIGLAQYQLSEYAEALQTLQQYLDEGGKKVPAKRRTAVEKQVLKLKDRVGTVAIECPDEGAEITIDGRPVGVTPLAEPVMVSVGRRTIVAKLGGRKVDQVVEVGGRDALTITLELPTGATPPDGSTSEPTGDTTTPPDEGGTETGSPDGDDGLSTGVIVAWAATGVLAVAAVGTGVGALASSGELADQRDTLGVDPEELESTSDRVFALGLTTDILIGAAAVMAGVSVYLTLTDGDDGEEPANQTRFVVSPFGVGLTGSF